MASRRELLRSLLSSYRTRGPARQATRTFASTRASRNVVRELEQRGMLSELTRYARRPFRSTESAGVDKAFRVRSRAARQHVEKPTTVYLGVDPSARSLHVGNLLALIGLLHFRLYGHNAVALVCAVTYHLVRGSP